MCGVTCFDIPRAWLVAGRDASFELMPLTRGTREMQERTTRRFSLALCTAAARAWLRSRSSAILIKNMTTGEVLFYDGFEGVNSSPSAALL